LKNGILNGQKKNEEEKRKKTKKTAKRGKI